MAGLLDTDGYLANTSGLIFCNTNKTLAEDVYWLARSVGYYAKVKEYTAKIKNINYQTTAYKVYISAKSFIDLPMLLAYKKPNKKMKRTDPQKTGISIECIGKGEYYGFALQGKDCLFILEDFTVTHNSIFAVNSAIQLAKLDLKVVYFSLEMSKLQVVERIVTHICTINNMALKEGELKKEFKEGKNLFTEWADSNRLLIDDKYGYDFDTLIKVCQVTEPDFVIIDHIQMIKATGKGGKLEAIEEYIRRLKQLSLECNFGIILLSQINRGGISNPGMEFLKWGGILEELADTCIIITTDWQNFITHFNIAKQRHRGTGTLDLKIEPQYSKFREFTNEEREQNAGTYFRDN